MSHPQLQRFIARLHHDPALVARLGSDTVFDGEDLDVEERQWVRAVDPRAFLADGGRRGRLIVACAEECPASVAFALTSGRGLDDLLGFCSSEGFHQSVRRGAALPLALLRWLQDPRRPWMADRRAGALIALESALAAARRVVPEPLPEGWIRTRPGVVATEVKAGTTALYGALLTRLRLRTTALGVGATMATAACDPRLDRSALPKVGVESEGVVCVPDGRGGFDVGTAPRPLVALLRALQDGVSSEYALAAAETAGSDREDCASVLGDLLDEGLLDGARPRG